MDSRSGAWLADGVEDGDEDEDEDEDEDDDEVEFEVEEEADFSLLANTPPTTPPIIAHNRRAPIISIRFRLSRFFTNTVVSPQNFRTAGCFFSQYIHHTWCRRKVQRIIVNFLKLWVVLMPIVLKLCDMESRSDLIASVDFGPSFMVNFKAGIILLILIRCHDSDESLADDNPADESFVCSVIVACDV
jgi:hypothetical protein